MKGVKKKDEQKYNERGDFVTKLFTEDCRSREARGWIDPPMSAPMAQQAIAKRFGKTLNSQRLYQLRREVFAKFKLDERGRPTFQVSAAPETPRGPTLVQARRDPSDPMFSVALVPTADETQGEFLRGALSKLAAHGLVDPDLRVDDVHQHYATVSRFPK